MSRFNRLALADKSAVQKSVSTVVAGIAIVVAIIAGLGVGLIVPSISGGPRTTTEINTLVSTQTLVSQSTIEQVLPTTVTQTTAQTLTRTQTQNETKTLAELSTQTVIHSQTLTQTIVATSYITLAQTTTETYIVTMAGTNTTLEQIAKGELSMYYYNNYQLLFPNKTASISVQTFNPRYDGYILVQFQSAEGIHWQLSGANLTEVTPTGATSGTVQLPVSANSSYYLVLVNDNCGASGCGGSFGVNVTIAYYY